MADEILVNDGSAPARIIPYTAGGAITAGRALAFNDAGNIIHAVSGATHIAGFALVDAASGTMASVITGKGVLLRATCSGAISGGKGLKVSDNGAGVLTESTTNIVAQTAEVKTASGQALTKVITL